MELFTLVIPAHNEEGSLKTLINELTSVLTQVRHPFKVLFINDCSTDETAKILEQFAQTYDYLEVKHLEIREGQTGCFQYAIENIKSKFFIRMDADLQDNPSNLLDFYRWMQEDYDLIMGLREIRRHKRLIRFASILYDALIVLLFDTPLHTNTSSFLCFKMKYAQNLKLVKNDHRYLPVIIMVRGAEKLKEIIIESRERQFGESKYKNYQKLLYGPFEILRFILRLKIGYYTKDIKN